ncbi:hypothetical protein SDC9_139623 [bioreactor metagenome]|uniref:Cysteine synthase n=1 Tax=bioreactor metagenome TaxID=1076179 RepID=A0A645DTL9_9ZZZZ
MDEKSNYHGFVSATGSAGTIAAGDYLKKVYPKSKIAASEALQCPTIYMNGFGAHRIEGIGDKHIPWIHNVKNTDVAVAVDDEIPMQWIRMFNEEEGLKLLREKGVSKDVLSRLPWVGISGASNLISAINYAKYFELTENDVVATVGTDSADMYASRIEELNQQQGEYDLHTAARDYSEHLHSIRTDSMLELTYAQRKRVHNLKYYTWVEQQGKTVEELNAQWYDDGYWTGIHAQAAELDTLIDTFNEATGVLKNM